MWIARCLLVPVFILLFPLNDYLQEQRGWKLVTLPSGEEFYDYQDSWALLIGINRFQFCSELNYAVQDAESVKELLLDEFNFKESNIILLTDDEASLQNIREAMQSGLISKVGTNDRVLVFWAGHGLTVDLPGGGESGFLVPVDGQKEQYYSTCLSMDELSRLAAMIPAKHILFLVDACYGGLSFNRRRGLSSETAAYLEKITSARGRQIITAGRRDEEVIEDSRWGHSVFTYKLLDGLKNRLADNDADGLVTASELYNYLQKRVTEESRYRQTPQFGFLSGEGEFVFITKDAYAPAEDITGTVYVRTNPWCYIYLDGEMISESNYVINDVPAGDHEIILKREGYLEIKKRFTISRNVRDIKIIENLVKE